MSACCFQYIKGTKKKANHNLLQNVYNYHYVVSNTSKVLKRKQITTYSNLYCLLLLNCYGWSWERDIVVLILTICVSSICYIQFVRHVWQIELVAHLWVDNHWWWIGTQFLWKGMNCIFLINKNLNVRKIEW